jgi:hypothetical protein
MSAADWEVIYEDGVPVQMRWRPQAERQRRRCPRTFPHAQHGPWFDGQLRPAGGPGGFDCPGVEVLTGERQP